MVSELVLTRLGFGDALIDASAECDRSLQLVGTCVLYAARLAPSGAPALGLRSWAGCRVTAPYGDGACLSVWSCSSRPDVIEDPTQDVAFPGLLLG